jgi:hypothetical protein
MPNDVPPPAPISAVPVTPAIVNSGSANLGEAATPKPATVVVHTPTGRPLLHFSNYDGQVLSALAELSGAINKLGAAVEKFSNLPQHEQVMA